MGLPQHIVRNTQFIKYLFIFNLIHHIQLTSHAQPKNIWNLPKTTPNRYRLYCIISLDLIHLWLCYEKKKIADTPERKKIFTLENRSCLKYHFQRNTIKHNNKKVSCWVATYSTYYTYTLYKIIKKSEKKNIFTFNQIYFTILQPCVAFDRFIGVLHFFDVFSNIHNTCHIL